VPAVHAPALVGVPEDDVEDRVEVRLRPRQLEAAACELDRRLEQPPPGQRRVCTVRLGEAGDGARDGAGRRADAEDLAGLTALEGDVDRLHLGGLRAGTAE